MKNPNVSSFDSKGRILVPIHIRNMLKAEEGTEVVIIPDDDKRQVKLIPLAKGKTAEMRFLLEDAPGSLAKVARLLSQNNLNIILSESRTLTKGKLAEWDVVVDTSECNNLNMLKKRFLELDNVKNLEIIANNVKQLNKLH